MKKILLSAAGMLAFGLSATLAQEFHDSFKKEAELKQAFVKMDMTEFLDQEVNFVCDSIDRPIKKQEVTFRMKQNIAFPKKQKYEIKKASETNNGYVQTYGIYVGEDAVYYVRFNLNPLTSKLEEIKIERNN